MVSLTVLQPPPVRCKPVNNVAPKKTKSRRNSRAKIAKDAKRIGINLQLKSGIGF